MQFLTPWLWIAALSISIPVILHLTRKESRNPTLFSSLMFFHKIPLQEFRRRRLRNLLLLALRCLAIFFLVAAFAQPVLTEWAAGGIGRSAVSTVILVDNSLSMSRPEVWEQAKTTALQEIDRMGRQDESILVYFGLSNGALTRWEKDKSILRTAANQTLDPSTGSTSYAGGLRFAALQFEETENPNGRIVLITDLQESGIDQSALAEVILPSGVSLEIKNVGLKARNFYISRMQIEREVFSADYLLPVIVHVSGTPDDAVSAEIRLYLEDELIQRKEFTLTGKRDTAVQFDSFDIKEGITKGKAVLGLKDDLAEDDIYHFVIERHEPFLVQMLSGNPDESVYFKKAMESGDNLPFKIETVSGTGPLEKNTARVIVLDDTTRIPAADALDSFVKQGGGLILTHGRNANPDNYRSIQKLLPGLLTERRFARSFNSSYFFWDSISWDHPVFSIFDGSGTRLLGSIQFYGFWKLAPGENSRVLVRFNSGDPALLEKELEKGRIYQLATSLGRSWSDFPLRSAYVPFWHQIVHQSAGWNPRPDSHIVADLIAIALERDTEEGDSVRDWEVLDPSGRRIISLGGESPDTIRLESSGFYEIRRDRGTDWVAVNVDPRESDLSPVSEAQLLNLLFLNTPGTAPGQITADGPETLIQPVWWLLLMLSAMLFMSEAFYSNWQRKRRDQLT